MFYWLVKQNSFWVSLLPLSIGNTMCHYLCAFFFDLQMTVYSNGVSVLMPGDDIPTFIAHPAPVPCPPQNISQSQHQHSSSRDSSNSNSIQECWRLFIYLHHHSPLAYLTSERPTTLSWVEFGIECFCFLVLLFLSPNDFATLIGFGEIIYPHFVYIALGSKTGLCPLA